MQYSQFILLENKMNYHRNSTTNCNVELYKNMLSTSYYC